MSFVSLAAVQNDEEFGGQRKWSDYDEITCRICRDSDLKEPLVSPCNCKGSLGLVHVACLHRWLLEARRSRCEVCGAPYQVERRLRRCAVRSLAAWWCVPRSRTRPRLLCRRARRALYAETSVAMAAGAVLSCGLWACVVLADHYATRAAYFSGRAHDGEGPSVIQIGAQVIAAILVLLMSGSVICFSWWTINVLRKQARIWYYWWQHDVMMVVIAEPITVSDYRRRTRVSHGPGLATATSELKPSSASGKAPPAQQPPPSPQPPKPPQPPRPPQPQTQPLRLLQQPQSPQSHQQTQSPQPPQPPQPPHLPQPPQPPLLSQSPQPLQSSQSPQPSKPSQPQPPPQQAHEVAHQLIQEILQPLQPPPMPQPQTQPLQLLLQQSPHPPQQEHPLQTGQLLQPPQPPQPMPQSQTQPFQLLQLPQSRLTHQQTQTPQSAHSAQRHNQYNQHDHRNDHNHNNH